MLGNYTLSSGAITSGAFPYPLSRPYINPPALRIVREDLIFLAETRPEPERSMLISLYDKEDHHVRDMYADYLEDQGRTRTAKQVREGWTLGIWK